MSTPPIFFCLSLFFCSCHSDHICPVSFPSCCPVSFSHNYPIIVAAPQGIVEEKAGVAGYRQTQENLEKVSATKSELDDVKGRTLEDMSEMVRRLHSEIAERRNVLAPILREIRPLRERVQVG